MKSLKTIFQKTMAILTILIILTTQYIMTGLIEATYAIDLLATQHENVQFRAYFKNGEEELTEIEKAIDTKDLKLKIDVAVRNQGYFNGQISLENAGFEFTQVTSNNGRLENGVIYLNQIGADQVVSLEVGIEYFDEDEIEAASLNRETIVKLNGTYTYDNGEHQTIDAGSPVRVTWKRPSDAGVESETKILTNGIYRVGEENKRVVQLLVSCGMKNNAYPVSKTVIKVSAPSGATNVKVHKRSTNATNGDKEFTTDNYSVTNNELTITVNNTEVDGKISWKKGTKDIFVITYEYPTDTPIYKLFQIDAGISDYSMEFGETTHYEFYANREIDGISTVSKQEKESQIYKGKIYSGEAREITSYTIVHVDYVDGIKELEVTEQEAKYVKEYEENGVTNSIESDANVEIAAIKVNKEDVEKVLGDMWSLRIGELEINQNSQTDENGDMQLTLPEGMKTATIKISKPVNNGQFVIKSTKKILNTTHTREEKKEFNILKDISKSKCTINNDNEFYFTSTYNIGLKDTETKASIQSEQQALIATGESQPLNLNVVLEAGNEKQDLFKNPIINIILPSQIEDVTFTQKPQLIFENGLQLSDNDYKIVEENGKKVINIKLTGEQTSYHAEATGDTTIQIKTNVKVNQNAGNSAEEILFSYTNENATQYANNGTNNIDIQVVANNNQGNNDQGQNQNQGNNDNQEQNQGDNNQEQNQGLNIELEASVGGESLSQSRTIKAGEIITYTAKIRNNGNTDKNGLIIEALVPENTVLVEINPLYPGQVENSEAFSYTEPYFVEKSDRTITKENVSIQAGKEGVLKYSVKARKDIADTTQVITKLTIKENNSIIKEEQLTNNLEPADLVVELTPYGRESNAVMAYNVGATYILKVYNNTNTVQQNVKVTINNNELIDLESIEYHSDETTERITDGSITFNIPSIPVNDCAFIRIVGKVLPYTEQNNIVQLSGIAECNNKVYKSNIIAEEVTGEKVSIDINSETTSKDSNNNVKSGDIITYTAKIKNIGKIDATDLTINIAFSDYLEMQDLKINGTKISNYITEKHFDENEPYNILKVNGIALAKGNEITLEIKGKVSDNLPEKSLEIINRIEVYGGVGLIYRTNDIKHYVKGTSNLDGEFSSEDNENSGNDNNNGGNNGNNGNNNGGSQGSNNENGYSISGTVWKDTNKDGVKQNSEKKLEGITTYVINADTNEIIRNSKTDSSGKYIITNLSEGKYIVAFLFDTKNYDVTIYKASGVSESQNSDAVKVNKVIDNKEKTIAITDVLNTYSNQTDIDLGLIELKKSNIKIEKTISKITVTNKGGTKKYNFKNTNLAKVEIASKYLKGSNVVVEYSIKVKNTGSTETYIKNIIDILPSALEFNSNLNTDWYKKDGYLYNSKLNNTKINAGEEKEVKLVLIKKMTASNTGLVNNKAKIDSAYSSDGTEISTDITSSADMIVSIKTGKAVVYISFVSISLIILCGIVYLVKKETNEMVNR